MTFADAAADAQWRISLRDLDALLGLDGDHDQRVSSAELAQHAAALSSYLLDRLELHADGAACTLDAKPSEAVSDYLHFNFRAQCPAAPLRLAVRYDLFFDHDPSHISQLLVNDQAAILMRADARAVEVVLGKADVWQQTLAYLEQGVWHIWTGYDHILFLCTLLLPALFARRPGDQPVLAALKIVSAFTLAHSITLSLAALQVVALPSRWVEATIAASVCWAALNNLYHWVTRRIWLVVFAFGLVHGFGFASVLHELGLPSSHLLAALVAFNAGVELGQLAIVLAVVPLAFALRRFRWDSPLVLQTGSLIIAAVGGIWFFERALDTSLPQALSRISRSTDEAELSQLLRSAQEASERRAWREASTLLTRASHVAGEQDSAEVWRRMGALYVAQADLPGAQQAYERALTASQAAEDLRGTADAERGLGMVAKLSGDRALAMRRYRHALAADERLNPPTRAASDATELAALYLEAKLYSDAEAMYSRAAALHERSARPVDAANQYANLAQVLREQGKLGEASALFARSLELFRQHGEDARAGRVQQLMAELGTGARQ